ncbi:MAG: cation diffusion facilitator family transporter [Desulfobulbaceae bacterium]|nr:cation diffusion facilitator family transporter [Desulfobulbaceae bacterium]
MQRTERFNRADKVIKVGFWINGLLMVMKLLAGYFGKSEAVFADGLESACDFIAILSTLFALNVGRKPFDEEHPYGHGKAESISAVLVSLLILATGAGILFQSVHTIMVGTYQEPQLIAVFAAVVTIGVKEALCRYSLRVGEGLGSPAVLAIAKDHRKDAVTSVATLIGVTAAFCGFRIMDPLAAGLTAFFIFHIGYQTFMSAAHELMDGQPPGEMISAIVEIAEPVEGVEHVHEIRGRRSGQYIIVDLKLDMHPEMSVKRSHDIAVEVKRRIFDRFPEVGDVMIHVNPHDEEHEDLVRL